MPEVHGLRHALADKQQRVILAATLLLGVPVVGKVVTGWGIAAVPATFLAILMLVATCLCVSTYTKLRCSRWSLASLVALCGWALGDIASDWGAAVVPATFLAVLVLVVATCASETLRRIWINAPDVGASEPG